MSDRSQNLGAQLGELVGVVAMWIFLAFVVLAIPVGIVLMILDRP